MEHRQAKVNDDTDRRLDQLAADRDLNDTEAVRIAINQGLAELGYGTKRLTPDTRLRATLREIARILGYGGGVLIVAATVLPYVISAPLPSSVELAGIVVAAAGVFAFSVERVLAETGATPIEDLVSSQQTDVAADGGTPDGGENE